MNWNTNCARKGGTSSPGSILARALPLALSLALVATSNTGCDRGGGSEGSAASADGSTAATSDPTREAQSAARERIRDRFAAISKRVQAAGNPAEKLRQLEGFIRAARTAAATDRIQLPEIQRAETLMKEVQQELELAANGAFAELESEVNQILHAPEPDHTRAEALVERFPKSKYPGTDLDARVEALLKKVQLYQAAEMDFLSRISRLEVYGQDYARAIGFLEGFDPDYDETPYGEKIRTKIKEYYDHYARAKVGRQETLDSVKTETWKLSQLYIWEAPDADVVHYKDGVLSLGPNPGDYEEKDTQGSYIALGDGTWIDVHITFEARVAGPARIRFGARGHLEERSSRYAFTPLSLERLGLPEESEEDQWLQFVVQIEGSDFTINCTSTGGSDRLGGLSWEQGSYFVLWVLGDEAALHVRRFQYKLLRRDEEAAKELARQNAEGDSDDNGGDDSGDESGDTKGGDGDEDAGDEGDDGGGE